MDYEQLKAEHADVFNAVFAAGVAAEKKRVEDHLKLAEASGDLKTAKRAIKEGLSIDDVRADYLAAQINQSNIANRTAEAPASIPTTGQKPGNTAIDEEREKFLAANPRARVEWGK